MYCRSQFIDTARLIEILLLNLANDLAEGIHKIKYKYRHNDKKCEYCGIKYKYCNCFFLECINFKDDLIKYKFCNKNHENFLMMT